MSLQLIEAPEQLSPANSGTKNILLNFVEPAYLADIFMTNPPIDFKSVEIVAGAAHAPAFLANFDLLTTLDEEASAWRELIQRIPFARRFLCFPTIFVGTTATEYAIYPDQDDYKFFISALLHEMRKQNAQLVIVKDIPQQSPLLSKFENDRATLLQAQCKEAGFIPVEGQALAYVPVDFNSVDEYMNRLSKVRRKEFRKKLKQSASVQIEEASCGSALFWDQSLLEEMYCMYKNVFAQSEMQFDVLSKSFFREILQNQSGNGIVFFYRMDERLIGYNICFVHDNRLVDKYVGFVYPEARKHNLYFLSWFHNIEYALKHGLESYIAGWTDPLVKKSLGGKFTLTRHAVYIRNPILRAILKPIKHLFESDSNWIDKNA